MRITRRILKIVSIQVILSLLFEIGFPTIAKALTSGPSQPEMTSFEPAGTSQMVDVSSGAFNYNIPLLDIDGYPITLCYHSGITMDQEASWVGLGWNINPGAVNREMRGIPDDFNGDSMTRQMGYAVNSTSGAEIGGGGELFGAGSAFGVDLSAGIGISENTFTGTGLDISVNPSAKIANVFSTPLNAGVGLGLDISSQNGLEVSAYGSLQCQLKANSDGDQVGFGASAHASYSTRQGLKELTFGSSENVNQIGINSGGVSIPIGTPTYVPEYTLPMTGNGVSYWENLGGEGSGFEGYGYIKGYAAREYLVTDQMSIPAYGYMYAENVNNAPTVIQDFNRERDQTFVQSMKQLPLANQTFDIYTISGQGIDGMFRGHRSDVGIVYDNYVSSSTSNANGGIEIAAGDIVKVGVNGGNTWVNSSSGNWSVSPASAISSILNFKGSNTITNPNYEPTYFKMGGEVTTGDQTIYNQFNATSAAMVKLTGSAPAIVASNSLTPSNYSGTIGLSYGNSYLHSRTKRNYGIRVLTAQDASLAGFDTTIKSYPNNYWARAKSGVLATCIPRVDPTNKVQKKHHISEITVTKPDGSKYVYGIPVYNLYEKDASFAVADKGHSYDWNNNTTTYIRDTTLGSQNIDNSPANSEGIDHYYSSNSLPPYAHSYLLTAVLSPDYQDVKNDGVTDDDFGSAIKFNYNRKYYNGPKPYRWRVPYKSLSAYYNMGLITRTNDQRGSYTYGTKEVWYLHSVESKNYVAEFITSKRDDGYGVKNENGGMDTSQSLYKLDSIKLYAKHDRIQHGNAAIPLKIITFQYDYELCPDVDNNDGNTVMAYDTANINHNKGKLTLKKVYFFNGNSTKGRLTPYQFRYADPTHSTSDAAKYDTINVYNPHYDIEKYDRWGFYKNDKGKFLKNFLYPYVDQDSASTKANVYSQAWCLTTIILPSGGLVKIDYESNDYAYVQDKRAAQMFQIVGTATDGIHGITDTGDGDLFDFNDPSDRYSTKMHNNMYFKVKLMAHETNVTTFKAHYITGIRDLYFKCLMEGTKNNAGQEFVSGYVGLDSNHCALDTTHNYAYIKYLTEGIQDDGSGVQCNPVAKAGWQFTRLNNNALVFQGADPSTGYSNLSQSIQGLGSVFTTDIPIMVNGFNKYCQSEQFSYAIVQGYSWIRLLNPTFKKYGGGVRVKQLTMTDSWNTMETGAFGSSYGQTYNYQVYTPNNGWISSGVASYEPMIGNDENPFRLPISYTQSHPLSTSIQLYQEGPYGESFFPAPRIVYNTVKVTNIKPSTGIKRTGTGFTVYEFYTDQDFPVILGQTGIDPRYYQPVTVESLISIQTTANATMSQGYSIEVNDMAGKPKAVWQYAENQPEFTQGTSRAQSALSGVEYVYNTSSVNPKQLNNYVTVIDSAGHMLPQPIQMGVDLDCVADMRESSTNSHVATGEINVDAFWAAVLPLVIPTFIPNTSDYTSIFRSVVVNKVITRTGIQVSTIYHDNGQSTKSVNVAWDKETGEVLLQKTYNEFGDSIYNFTYPAHWMPQYTNMDQASINDGVRLQKVTFDSHGAMGSTANSYFVSKYLVAGDKVLLYVHQNNDDVPCYYTPLWVYFSHSKYFLIDPTGQIFTPISQSNQYDLKIIHSGRKNMASTAVGKLVARNVLYQYNRLNYGNILDASATTFSQNWQTFCCGFTPWYDGSLYQSQESICSVINPFTRNVLGEWRPLCNYAFIGSRTSSSSQIIQQEGNYSSFTPFWAFDSTTGNWNAATGSKKWQWATQVTQVSPFGYQLETKDTLGRYNSALYGYNNSLNVAVASNAKYQQIGFDGFEDYAYAKVNPDNTNPDYVEAMTQYPPDFGFFSPFSNSMTSYLCNDTSHTGTYSFRLGSNQKDSFSRALNIISTSTPTDTAYRLKLSDCLGYFSPNDSGKYVLSAWVRVQTWDDSASYTNPYIKLTIQKTGKPNVITTLKASGNIIEGWQRIEGTFYIRGGAKNIIVSLNADPAKATYFDDLRIFPFNASMKSFVYDPKDLRLKATLDENNYATFYEYDEEGNLVRIKKETTEGIRTVQETRKHVQ